MKVLLVQSYLGGNEPPVFPLGLACTRSQLNGYNVRGFDTNISKRPFAELKEIISSFSPDVIGMSLRNIDSTNKRKVVFYYRYLKDAINVIKTCSDAKIIVGGSGFSMFAREIMEDEPRIDFGVFLEGEETFPNLLQNLDKPEDVRSVFYRKNGRVVFSGAGRQVDINSVGSRDLQLISPVHYKHMPDAIGVETKRGCILDCVYCIYGFLNGKELRLKDPAKVVDEIDCLVKAHGIQDFTFVDSVFNIPVEHAIAICKEMVARNIKVGWSAWFNEKGLTREFVELVRKAGCKKLILSPDGFSDTVLKELGKNIIKRDIIKSYKILKNLKGFDVCYNFFKNPKGQSLWTFLSLIIFFIKGKLQMGRRVHFEFNSLRIEPYTRLYQIAVADGFLKNGENLLYPKYYTNPQTWYIEKIFNILLRLKGG